MKLIAWLAAFVIAPWFIVAGLLYGLYRLTLWAPGMTFALLCLIVWVAIYKLITANHDNR